MKDSPTKTICFFHSPRGWGEEEQRVLAACKEEMRNGKRVILVTSMSSRMGTRAIQERIDVYRFRIGKLSFLNPFQIGILILFISTKSLTELRFSKEDEKLEKVIRLFQFK